MPNDERDASRVVAFVVLATALSLMLGVAAWAVRLPSGYYLMRNGLLLVPSLSVMLAAQGVAWRRKLAFTGGTLAGFVAVEVTSNALGVQALAADGARFGVGLGPTLVTLAYHTFLLLYPLVVLVFFVGNRPQSLWMRRMPDPRPAKKKRRR